MIRSAQFIPFSPQATYNALKSTYSFLTPDMWTKTAIKPAPFQVTTTTASPTAPLCPHEAAFYAAAAAAVDSSAASDAFAGAHGFPCQGVQVKGLAAARGAVAACGSA